MIKRLLISTTCFLGTLTPVLAQDFYGYNLADSLTITEISLRRQKLDVLPADLMAFKNLETLDLRNNKLDTLPESIGQLKHLKTILLSRNKLQHFPEVLKQITSLEHIDLWDNQITDLNFDLESFPHLKYLDISGILLQPDVYERLTEDFQSIEFNSSPPCDCMYLKKDK